MNDYSLFPVVNAILNGTSAVLIATGVLLIRHKRQKAHKRVMLSAVFTSSLFLVSYLYYHSNVGSVRFQGQGHSRSIYFAILFSHTVFAAAVVPLVLVTLTRGLRGRFDSHRASARWTYPVWLYVSITGVLIYVMLYQVYGHT